jgi:pSer/pThr/pTyr-binding forkhead associated (FHA) protein
MGTQKIESMVLKDGDEFTLGGARAFRVRVEEGSVETSGVIPSATVRSGEELSLPTEWKTRLEWSPEEFAVWEDARKKVRLADTATRRGPHSQAAPASAKAATAPESAAKPAATAPRPPVAPAKGATAASPIAATPEKSEPAPAISHLPSPSAKTTALSQADAKALSAPEARPAAMSAEEQPQAKTPTTPLGAVGEAPTLASPRAGAGASPPPKPPVESAIPPPSPSAEATQAISREAAKARVSLEGKTRTFSLSVGDHEVGRLPGMAICLDGSQISRHHAIVRVTDKEVLVEDHGSGNGTFVNMERISVPRRLENGDLLQFGDVGFHVRLPPDAGTPPR